MPNKTKKIVDSRKIIIPCLAALLLVVVYLGYTFVSKKDNAAVVVSGSQNTKGEQSSSAGGSVSRKEGSATAGNSSSDVSTTATTLLSPSGNFVSNHAPDQSHPTETSVCSSTPGATCTITFTKDGVSKSLTPQLVDGGGSTYWNNWKPADIGLTFGEWEVRATVTLGAQTMSTKDAIPLKVGS